MKTNRIPSILFFLFLPILAQAQQWMNLHRHEAGNNWRIPLRIDRFGEARTDVEGKRIFFDIIDEEGAVGQTLSFGLETVDSIDFSYDLLDEEKGHDKYRVFALYINTQDEAPIKEKETWLNCHFSLDGMGEYSNYSGTGRIRGRGNSTWEWYDKKPYKFKLDEKSKLLGLEKAKNWNLLANYRDVTDLMNALAFEVARCLGMPFTNHTRFVEVFLNNEYIGLYQLTEKLEVGKNRVDIDKEQGILLSFDLDDGPSLSPEAGDNFSSKIYRLPMCLKEPENPSPEKLDSVRDELAKMERAIQQHDYEMLDSLCDINSFIGILQIHEFLYNVEIDAPRSLYMFRDSLGKFTFGPVWDYDAGFDFDWGNMYTGHDFFRDYRELIYGTNPATHQGTAYNISGFWTDMFNSAKFVTRYKEQWKAVSDTILSTSWAEMERYLSHLREGAYARDFQRWPIKGKNVETEVEKMHTWLANRLNYLNQVIANYPAGKDAPDDPQNPDDPQPSDYEIVNGEIHITVPVIFNLGYSQPGTIKIKEEDVRNLLGGDPSSLNPLNVDGSRGSNTAAKRYGAWFDQDGDTNAWAWGHVYIESDDLYTWAYGCHPENCEPGDDHTVRMQYIRRNKSLTVRIHFLVE